MKTANFNDARNYLLKSGSVSFSAIFDYMAQFSTSDADLPDTSSIDAMLAKRTIKLSGEINEDNASMVQGLMMYLDSVSKQPITLVISSPGGSVYAGLGIYDTMGFVSSEVYTHGVGIVASMAAVLLSAGGKGHRCINEGTVIQFSDLKSKGSYLSGRDINEVDKLYKEICQILSDNTGEPEDLIRQFCSQGKEFTPVEAMEFELIDYIC